MAKSRDYTFRDLTSSEVWELMQVYFNAAIASSLIFLLPCLLFTLGEKKVNTLSGGETVSKWITYFFGFLILLFISFNIHDCLSSFGESCIRLANSAKIISKTKRVFWTFLFLLYFYCWANFAIITLSISCFILLPSEFTYLKYIRILEKKRLERMEKTEDKEKKGRPSIGASLRWILADPIGIFFMGVGLFLIIFGTPGILLWQCIHWLQDGYWTPLSLMDLYSFTFQDKIGWLGVKEVVNEFLHGALSCTLFLIGFIISFLGIKCHEDVEDQKSQRNPKKTEL